MAKKRSALQGSDVVRKYLREGGKITNPNIHEGTQHYGSRADYFKGTEDENFEKGAAVAYAHEALKVAAKKGDLDSVYDALSLYQTAHQRSLFSPWVRKKVEEAYNNRVKIDERMHSETDASHQYKILLSIIDKKSYPSHKKKGGLEGKASATTAIVGLIGGLFFLSSNITGNVIGLNQSTGNILGAVLLCVGLVGGFFWFRSRKR